MISNNCPRGNDNWMTLAISEESLIRLWCKEKGELWKAQPYNTGIRWKRVVKMATGQQIKWYITTYERKTKGAKNDKKYEVENDFDNLSMSTTF